jgi:hypothetical protein
MLALLRDVMRPGVRSSIGPTDIPDYRPKARSTRFTCKEMRGCVITAQLISCSAIPITTNPKEAGAITKPTVVVRRIIKTISLAAGPRASISIDVEFSMIRTLASITERRCWVLDEASVKYASPSDPRSRLDKFQQVRIDEIRVGGRHSVWQARIGLERAFFK